VIIVRQPIADPYSLEIDKDGKGHWVDYFWCNTLGTTIKKTGEAKKLYHDVQIMNVGFGLTRKELKYKIWEEEQYRRQSLHIIREDYEKSSVVTNHPFFNKGEQNSPMPAVV